MSDVSIVSAPSASASPAMLWPPLRIDRSTPWWRAKFTQATTSATPRQRAISAGRRSIMPFHSWRASS
jgi:hypothetical protein